MIVKSIRRHQLRHHSPGAQHRLLRHRAHLFHIRFKCHNVPLAPIGDAEDA